MLIACVFVNLHIQPMIMLFLLMLCGVRALHMSFERERCLIGGWLLFLIIKLKTNMKWNAYASHYGIKIKIKTISIKSAMMTRVGLVAIAQLVRSLSECRVGLMATGLSKRHIRNPEVAPKTNIVNRQTGNDTERLPSMH